MSFTFSDFMLFETDVFFIVTIDVEADLQMPMLFHIDCSLYSLLSLACNLQRSTSLPTL
jgi:hypothetical protein